MKANAVQIMYNKDIFSIDTNTMTSFGVEIFRHAGDFNEGVTNSYFPLFTLKCKEFDGEREAFVKATHVMFHDHGLTLQQTKDFAAKVIKSNDYLNKDCWVIDN